MNKVYIVCEPTHMKNGVEVRSVDLSPAALWGDPVVLLPNMQSLLSPASTIEAIKAKMETFDDSDYLVPIGDPILMCAVAVVAAQKNNGRIKFLKWDRRNNGYVPIQAELYTNEERE